MSAARTRPTAAGTHAPITHAPLLSGHPHDDDEKPLPARPHAPGIARSFPVISACGAPAAGSFPRPPSDTENIRYSYGGYHTTPASFAVADAVHRARHPAGCACCSCACGRAPMRWALAVPVPTPDGGATLRAVEYILTYGVAHGGGSPELVQTDVVLVTSKLTPGISLAGEDAALEATYTKEGGGSVFGPRMICHERALRLSTTVAATAGGTGDWGYYIENEKIAPEVRVGDGAFVFLVMHVSERPTAQIMRQLEVRVSATWQRKEVEEQARALEEEKRQKELVEKAKAAREKREREEEERRERLEARAARAEERAAREEERRERAAAQAERDAARAERAAADRERVQAQYEREERLQRRAAAAQKALDDARKAEADARVQCATVDAQTQARIDDALKRHGIDKCPQNFTWKRVVDGFVCRGGSHTVTDDQMESKSIIATAD